MAHLVGIDVGGTFTDLYAVSDDGSLRISKVPSTPRDPSRGLIDALTAAELPVSKLGTILHGTTIATNAVIERTGARCALLTTEGFRDVLELGRRDRPQLYGLSGVQKPLIERDYRWEVRERIDAYGRILTPLDEQQVADIARGLADSDVEVVVVAFLHSYANPAHELRATEILAAVRAGWHVVASHQVIPEYYEFERTSTAVVEGYLRPLISRYAEGLRDKLAGLDYTGDTLVMQSNGGVVSIDQMPTKAANFIRSGPAAGVIAATRLAMEAGFRNVITGDMGGTSFDVAVVRDGHPDVAETTQLDFRVPLRIPMVDVHTIGAGGGSVAHVDRGGILEVGPRSAGSYPGPVAFRRGGIEPTVTDANVVLGRIPPDRLIGEESETLDVEGARTAIGQLGELLGLSVEQTAEAIIQIVNQRMAARIRLMSVEQGQDPRGYVLVVFGGAGPLHGGALMEAVGVGTMLVPRFPGVLCAVGCAIADVQHDYTQTVTSGLADLDASELHRVLSAQAERGLNALEGENVPFTRCDVQHFADMAYLGQIHTVRVPIEATWGAEELQRSFDKVYTEEYGDQLGRLPVVVETVRTTVIGRRDTATPSPATGAARGSASVSRSRPVYFAGSWIETPVYQRETLAPGTELSGPAIIEQADTTTVIDPGMRCNVDSLHNLIVTLRES